MLKPIFIVVILTFTSLPFLAQNLVKNPSFEETDCDAPDDDFYYPALQWYNVTDSSPDYFSTSLEPGECPHGTPLGGQVPRNGTFMAGLWGSQVDSPTRDYIQSRLIEPMIQDTVYCIEMYVLRMESSPIAINRFGIQLTQDSLYDFNTYEVFTGGVLLSNPLDEFLTDAENWMHLSWEYQAQGGEEFITLGNFWEESELEYVDVEGTDTFPLAYYHIDDVSIIACSATSLIEETLDVNIGPNPVSDYLSVSFEIRPLEWTVYSMDGRSVKNGILERSGRIDFRELTSAVYLIELRDDIGRISTTLIYRD